MYIQMYIFLALDWYMYIFLALDWYMYIFLALDWYMYMYSCKKYMYRQRLIDSKGEEGM